MPKTTLNVVPLTLLESLLDPQTTLSTGALPTTTPLRPAPKRRSSAGIRERTRAQGNNRRRFNPSSRFRG